MDEHAAYLAIDELRKILRADGADLVLIEANAKTDRVRICVDLEHVICEECILPPDMLKEVIGDALRRRIPGEFELVLEDPRRR